MNVLPELDRTAGVLLPYQKRWVEDTAPVKVIEKGRRTGLTWSEASEDALLAASANSAGGMDVMYIGYNLDMAREFIDDCAMWAGHYHLAASDVGEFVFEDFDDKGNSREIKSFRIDFDSGFKILALSSRPRSIRGHQGKVVIDEAAFHDDLAGLMKAALAMLVWGGRVVVISTHNGEENPFNELIQECRAGKKPYSVHRIDFDQAIREGLYKRVCLRLANNWSITGEAAWREEIVSYYSPNEDEELFCIPAPGGGAYLTRAMIEANMKAGTPVIRWRQTAAFAELPKHIREADTNDWIDENLRPHITLLDSRFATFFGEDFGRTGDLTVIWPVQLDKGLVRRTPFTVELGGMPFEQQRQILFWLIDRFPRFSGGAMDAGGNGAYLAEVTAQEYGHGRIEQLKFTADFYRESMPKMKAALEDKLFDLPRDDEILDDFRAVELVRGVPMVPDTKRTKAADGGKRHGDAAIAAMLAWFATVNEFIEYGHTPAPNLRRARLEAPGEVRPGMRHDDFAEDLAARNQRGAW